MGAFGIGSSSSESKRVDPHTSDNAQVIWSGATLAQSGGLIFKGIKGGKGGVTLDFGSDLTGVTRDLIGVVDSSAQRSTDAITSTVTDALKQISTLSESAQTGGDSGRNKIILYVVLGVLGLLGLMFYWRK